VVVIILVGCLSACLAAWPAGWVDACAFCPSKHQPPILTNPDVRAFLSVPKITIYPLSPYDHRMDSVEALTKRLLPTLDVDFLQGEDFKSACMLYSSLSSSYAACAGGGRHAACRVHASKWVLTVHTY